jgi:indole-3-glycerol phosphate synthase
MDKLDEIIATVKKTVESGYYSKASKQKVKRKSLVKSIKACKVAPIIAEIKPASPSAGVIRKDFDIKKILNEIKKTKVVGLSILTEPKYFRGSLENLKLGSKTGLPVLMKDFVIDRCQIEVANKLGASAVLLIMRLFDRGYPMFSLDEAIEFSHKFKLEVVLEVNTSDEYKRALKSKADIIGINNRNLSTFEVEIGATKRILENVKKDRIIISMSGILSPQDIRYLKSSGADAFLVGTWIMASENIKERLDTLTKS